MNKVVLLLCVMLISVGQQVTAYCCVDTSSNDCARFYVRGDFLYWKPCLDGVAFALKSDESPFETADYEEKLDYAGDEWQAGFRLGFGFDSGCDYDLDLIWTRWEPEFGHTITADEGISLTPFAGYTLSSLLNAEVDQTTTVPQGKEVQANWDLCLDLIDFSLAKKLNCGECVLFRPHIDLRYAQIEQKLRLVTDGALIVNSGEEGAVGTYKYTSRFRNEFCGIGPRVGFDVGLSLDYHWGLYGSFAASLLYGDREAKVRETVGTVITEESKTQTFSRKSDHHCGRAMTDVAVGFYWNTVYGHGDCSYNVGFKCSWEHHYFFGQGVGEAARSTPLFHTEDGDLSTQGVTVTLALGF